MKKTAIGFVLMAAITGAREDLAYETVNR